MINCVTCFLVERQGVGHRHISGFSFIFMTGITQQFLEWKGCYEKSGTCDIMLERYAGGLTTRGITSKIILLRG